MKYHPDVAPNDPSAGETFKEITEAYAIMKKGWQKEAEITQQPEDPEFVSQRPEAPKETPDYRSPYETREYVNFKPLQVKLPENDRLGINYKPFFDDKDAVHPKAGTLWIIALCVFVTGAVSAVFFSLEEQDYKVNELLHQHLIRKYESKKWDTGAVFPGLQVFKQDPEYRDYLKRHFESDRMAKFKAFSEDQEAQERFSLYQADNI